MNVLVNLVIVFELRFKYLVPPGKIEAIVTIEFGVMHIVVGRRCFKLKKPVGIKSFGINFVAQMADYIQYQLYYLPGPQGSHMHREQKRQQNKNACFY